MSILTTLDNMDVFPRSEDGPIPGLIVDGHATRMHPKFLNYINDVRHPWRVWLGIPYATSYWQVGDSSEQNGSFKCHWYGAKKELVDFMIDHDFKPLAIRNENVMPLLTKAWKKSFANVVNVRKAIADRGWFPPTRKLLDHKEITKLQATITDNFGENQDTVITEENVITSVSESINFNNIFSQRIIDRIVSCKIREDGIMRRQKKLLEGNLLKERLKEGRSLTSGVLVSHGLHALHDKRVLQHVRRNLEQKEMAAIQKRNEKKKKIFKRKLEVDELRQRKGNDLSQYTQTELKTFVQYKRLPTDPKLPQLKGQQQKQALLTLASTTAGRESPDVSDYEDNDVDMKETHNEIELELAESFLDLKSAAL